MVPDFTKIKFNTPDFKYSDEVAWVAPEGIEIKKVYKKEDVEGIKHLNGLPGISPLCVAPTLQCIFRDLGQSDNMRASPQPKTQMLFTDAIYLLGKKVYL
jgi:hypothetical protein